MIFYYKNNVDAGMAVMYDAECPYRDQVLLNNTKTQTPLQESYDTPNIKSKVIWLTLEVIWLTLECALYAA